MPRELTLESEEWYVLCNWLRSRENRLMYALRSRSKEWEFVHELRRSLEDRSGRAEETSAVERTVTVSDAGVEYLDAFLRRRSRLLRFVPWRDRERRDVLHLRRQLRDQF